jgi:exonuclease III
MKIVSFNVNNIRKRLPNLLAWLDESAPDVVCLQELKTTDADFPTEALRGAGYEAVWPYGETFPELTHRPFTVLAMSAMRVAWPCEK